MIRYVRTSAARAFWIVVMSLGLLPGVVGAQSVSGTILGTVTDSTGAIVAGAKVTIVNEGTGLTRIVTADSNGEYTAPAPADGPLHDHVRDDRLQDGRALEHRGGRRSARPHQHQARDRRDDGIGQRHGRGAAAADVLVGAGDDRHQPADRGAPAQRPQLREPHANHSGRPPRDPGRQHRRRGQPRVARLGVVLGQRPAPARQQLHARRRRQQRDVAPDRRHLPERRRARRVQDADLDVFRGIRAVARRRREPADQVGHQQHARQRVRVPPQRRVRRQQLLQQPCGPRQAGLQAEPVRRNARRRGLPRQDVLLHRLPGPSRNPGADVPVDGAVACDAAR